MKLNKITALCLVVLVVLSTTYLALGINETDAKTSPKAIESVSGEVTDKDLIDVQAALKPRSLGDDDAPIIIEEFASLSCSHCASFHKETFDKINNNYIKRGKVKFIFNDFPLNGSALDGTIIARCMPEERYFKYIKYLFETQDKWAFDQDYQRKLLQSAKLAGGQGDRLQACLDNTALRQGLAVAMQENSRKHNVRSTPSFVFDNEKLITGAQPYEVFEAEIEKRLEAAKKK